MNSTSTFKMLRDGNRPNLAVLAQNLLVGSYSKNFWTCLTDPTTPVRLTKISSASVAPALVGQTITGGNNSYTGLITGIALTSGAWTGAGQGWLLYTLANQEQAFEAFESITASTSGATFTLINGDNLGMEDIIADAHLPTASTEYTESPTNGSRTGLTGVVAPDRNNVISPAGKDFALIAVIAANDSLARSNATLGRRYADDEDFIFVDATEAVIGSTTGSDTKTVPIGQAFAPVKGIVYVVGAIINHVTGKLEHWVDGIKRGEVNIPSALSSFTLSNYVGINTDRTGLVTLDPQDIYGVLNAHFGDGIPEDIGLFMNNFKSACLLASKLLPADYISVK